MPRIRYAAATLLALLGTGAPAPAQEAAGLLAAWSASYGTEAGDPTRLYTSDARLLGEFSPDESMGSAGVARYFATIGLGPAPLQMRIESYSLRETPALVLVSGRYTLLREGWDGRVAQEPSRFTLALRRATDGGWQIAEQHSSRVPELPR